MYKTDSPLRPTAVARLVFFCALATVISPAAVIDFEELTVNQGDYHFADPVVSKGFSLSTVEGGYEFDADGATRGSKSFFTDSTPIILTRVGGGTFDLLSFFAAEDNFDVSRTLTVTGSFAGGGTVVATFVIDGLYDGGSGDYQLFTLPSTFAGLISVEFSDPSADLSLDDITTADPVPEPAGFALVGACIIAFWLRSLRNAG